MKIPLLSIAALLASAALFQEDPAAELLDADEAFCTATQERGLDGWLEWFAPDALILPPEGPMLEGLDELRRHYSSIPFPPPGFTWKPEEAWLAESADLGYTRGSYEIRNSGFSGEERIDRGRYLSVWRRQPDGGYKVFSDLGGEEDFRTRIHGILGPPLSLEYGALRWEVADSGDLAFTAGAWSVDAEQRKVMGRFITLWKRTDEGTWEVAAEIGS